MKKITLIALASALAAGAAFAALGDVVASWPSPAKFPLALARGPDPTQMWVYCNGWPNKIFRVNAETGSVYGSFLHYKAQNYTSGLTFSYGGPAPYSGSYLWVGDALNRCVYMSDPTTGSVYLSYSVASRPYGLAVEGAADGGRAPKAIFTSDGYSNAFIWRRQLTTGSIMSSFAATHDVRDIAYDWRNDLIWARAGDTIVGRDPATGSIAASFASPPGPAKAFTYHGEYLWIGTTTDYHRVYKVHCPGVLSRVVPSSLGRVKALFK